MDQSAPRMLFDKGSVRTTDVDGRMHVAVSNISMEQVAPYLGKEIVDFTSMGLDPETVYYLYRPGEELEKAAATFNNVPVLTEHVPVSADDHRPDLVVGATGTDAEYVAPYLRNSLVIWAAEAIEGINSGEQRELSCAYRYTPVLEDGTFNGQQYQIRMTDLIANHVALVAAGRAGPTVMVGDSQLETKEVVMTKKALSRKANLARGALLATLNKPKFLAADAKIDLNEIMKGVTAVNWKESKPLIVAAIKPKIAADADIQDVVKLLDMLDGEEAADDEPAAAAVVPPGDAGPAEEVLAMLKGKVDDATLAAIGEKLKAIKPAAAADVVPPEPKDDDKKDMVSKSAMDAALKAASDAADKRVKVAADEAAKVAEQNTMKRLHEIRQAEEAAQPYVGKLSGAFDSAEAVYRAALTALEVKHEGIHESALRAVLEAQPKPGATRPFAQDSKPSADYATRFPGAAAVRSIG